jgi:hypothetical protein
VVEEIMSKVKGNKAETILTIEQGHGLLPDGYKIKSVRIARNRKSAKMVLTR